MADSWKISAFASREAVEAALDAREVVPDWDEGIVLTGFEVAADKPEEWRLDAYLADRPGSAEKAAVAALFVGEPPELTVEQLPETDWVTQSQQSVKPIRAGRFHVHTPDHPPLRQAGVTDLEIPASLAFGTGQHETTAGCLAMLSMMKGRGVVARNVADIGTGTGLLAFAALDLWPAAYATASDIDPVCRQVVAENAARNHVPLGLARGQLAYVTAEGMDHDVLQAGAPYDLLIANILARPLIELAPDFDAAIAPRGNLLLAGLLSSQDAAVRRPYRRRGFALRARIVNGDWSILWLRKRPIA